MFAACSAVPARTTLHYSPPSVQPVRKSISTAQDHARLAKSALAISDLKLADTEIDALTNELLHAQTALGSLEKNVANVTDAANRAADEKNAALDSLARVETKRAAAVKQRNKLAAILGTLGTGLLLYVLRKPLGSFLGSFVRHAIIPV